MRRVSIAEAKAHLSEIIDQARAGEDIEITRRGELVATLSGAPKKKKPIDVDAMKRLTDKMRRQSVSAGEFIRQMRDEDRY